MFPQRLTIRSVHLSLNNIFFSELNKRITVSFICIFYVGLNLMEIRVLRLAHDFVQLRWYRENLSCRTVLRRSYEVEKLQFQKTFDFRQRFFVTQLDLNFSTFLHCSLKSEIHYT